MRFPRPPRVRRLPDRGPFTVFLVDGEQVRNALDVDFTMGGTNARWPFIPTGEIWIDECLSDFDREATVLHEMEEFRRMRGPERLGYEEAHDLANVVERKFRRTR